jgi:hypothetical protein
MPLALPPTKTFADMLAELRSRCKLHATIGSTPALESILTEANDYVFGELDDGLPWRSTLSVYAGQAEFAPFITDEGMKVARGSVQSVWIEQGDASRVPLSQGITHAQRADASLRSIPELYDTTMRGGVGDQGEFTLEVWPTPDQAYTLHIEHNRILSRFSASSDKPCAPYRLVLGYAIAMAKAHLGQPDAETAGQAFRTMLTSERSRQRENRRFVPPSSGSRGPQVVRTATGYRQIG